MVTINGTTGVSKVQDGTITSAKIVDASVTNADLLTSSGIGYKTGDGGSVTQLTSKSTTVTLNKVCGQITMNNAALAAGVAVSFVLNNSFLGLYDCFSVGVGGGSASPESYRVIWRMGGGGAVVITVSNISAGSLSEALLINFAVIKGSIA